MKNHIGKNDLLIKELEAHVQVRQEINSMYKKHKHNESDLFINIKTCTKKQNNLIK